MPKKLRKVKRKKRKKSTTLKHGEKSQKIREYIRRHPDKSNKEVIEGLAAAGITVRNQYVRDMRLVEKRCRRAEIAQGLTKRQISVAKQAMKVLGGSEQLSVACELVESE